MDILLKVLDKLRIVLSNPALDGGSSLRTSEASEILRLIITLAQDPTTAGGQELGGLVDVLTDMGEGGRGPTPLEWINIRGCQAEYDAPPEEDTQVEEEETSAGGKVSESEPEKKKSIFKKSASKKATKSKK